MSESDLIPPTLDDTQPMRPVPDDTQPGRAVGMAPRLWRRLAAGALAAGAALALFLLAQSGGRSAPVTVTLVIAGDSFTVETAVEDVAALLEEQGIMLDAGDLLTPGLTTRLDDGMTIRIERARTVALTIDGQTSILRTVEENPEAILRDAGLTLAPGDRVLLDGTETTAANLVTWPVPVTSIEIVRAVTIQIVDGGQSSTLRTTRQTVGEALFEAGITLFAADTVTPTLGTPVTPDLVVTIDRSRPLTLIVDGRRIETRTRGETVADALIEAGVTLTGLDFAVPAEAETVLAGMTVRVIRVTEEIIIEQETLAYETIYQADPNLELDRRTVLQAGQTGARERTIRIRYENGIEISRVTESDELIREPVNQIVAYGTNIVIRTLDTPDGPVQYWRVLRVYATSYHPAALGGDNITATGRVLTRGIVGIEPRIIPYGTNIYVEGYGLGIAADTGLPRANPYWIDLGYDDENWVNWHWWVDVYLLTPVPENVNYLLPVTSEGGPIR